VIESIGQPKGAEQLARALPGGVGRGPAYQLGQHDILDRIEFRQQVMELVDETQELAPQPCPALVVQLRSLLAGETDRAFEPALEQPDGLQQRRLARARWTEQRDDFTGSDCQVHPAKDNNPGLALDEAALEIIGLEDGSCRLARLQRRLLTHSVAPAPDRFSRPCAPGRG
jgi:hypothetical protein